MVKRFLEIYFDAFGLTKIQKECQFQIISLQTFYEFYILYDSKKYQVNSSLKSLIELLFSHSDKSKSLKFI